jgi:hypothetical protein
MLDAVLLVGLLDDKIQVVRISKRCVDEAVQENGVLVWRGVVCGEDEMVTLA